MIIRFLIGISLIIHGLAHVSGFIASLTGKVEGFSVKPWIFSKTLRLKSPAGRIFGLLWITAMFLLVVAGTGVILRSDWWPIFALYGALASLIAIVPWWFSVPPGAKIGMVYDLLIIGVVATRLLDSVIEMIC